MIIKSVTMENFEWLFYVWAFNKNYIGSKKKSDAKFITFESLFEAISKKQQDDKASTE